MYSLVRQILIGYLLSVCRGQADTDWIFIECMQGSGGLLTQYSLGVFIGQADIDQIFIERRQGSGGLLIMSPLNFFKGSFFDPASKAKPAP